jgi:hypothetical protein
MICPYCGKENPEHLDICEFCGGPLTTPSEETAAESYSPEPNVTIIQSAPEINIPQVEPAVAPPQAPRGIYGNKIWWLVGCFVLVLLFLCCAVGSLVVYRSINGLASFLPASKTSTPMSLSIESIPTASNPKESIPTTSNPTASLLLTSMPLVPKPSATNSPNSNRELLFFDDFSDPNSGWDRADVADYYADYYNGAYRIIVHSDMSDSWANPDGNSYTDVSIEVDATKNAGPDDNDFGVICRYQGADQFYYAVISSDGYYGITKVTSNSSTHLGGGEMQHSNYINQGSATNHIRFDCSGNVLTLYVNGQQLDRQTDAEYTSGNVGLIAGTYGTAGTDILFDNFSVFKP